MKYNLMSKDNLIVPIMEEESQANEEEEEEEEEATQEAPAVAEDWDVRRLADAHSTSRNWEVAGRTAVCRR